MDEKENKISTQIYKKNKRCNVKKEKKKNEMKEKRERKNAGRKYE